MGIGSLVSRNTLANANEMRDWRIYADLTQILINKARPLYADEDFGEQLRQATLYALDASTIDLCLSLFPWAHFRKTKAAIKLPPPIVGPNLKPDFPMSHQNVLSGR